MKTLIHILCAGVAGIVCCSCSDEYNVDPISAVNLDISVDNDLRFDEINQAYVTHLNDPVSFSFRGDLVDNILFYSGEIGHEYRYRDRVYADPQCDLKPTILIRTGLSSPQAEKSACFRFLVSHDLEEYSDRAVSQATWLDVGELDLRDGNRTSSDVTQYYYPTLGIQNESGLTDDYTEWLSGEYVVYGIQAKSNEAQYNRLKLRQFDVSNVETRDYSFTLDGTEVVVKKSLSHPIFEALSPFDSSFKVTNDETPACWASYTPSTTVPEGTSEVVPNSQLYRWNVAEMGLKYGEGSGYPWVRTNAVGQDIKCTYDTEVWEPNKNIDLGNGVLGTTPTEAMKKQPSESWLVSRRHHVRQVSRDEVSSYVKIKSMSMVWNFSHTFLDKGLYTVTFVLNNQNRNETEEKVVEFKIIVID